MLDGIGSYTLFGRQSVERIISVLDRTAVQLGDAGQIAGRVRAVVVSQIVGGEWGSAVDAVA